MQIPKAAAAVAFATLQRAAGEGGKCQSYTERERERRRRRRRELVIISSLGTQTKGEG